MVQTLDMRAATEGIWRMTSSLVSPLKWCKIPWLLKNSFAENSQKKLCDRKPYKRRSPIWWTFTIPQISAVFAKPEFFNSHACLQQLPSNTRVEIDFCDGRQMLLCSRFHYAT